MRAQRPSMRLPSNLIIQNTIESVVEKGPELAFKAGPVGWAGGSMFTLISKNPSLVASFCSIGGFILTLIGLLVMVIKSIRQDRREAKRLKIYESEHPCTVNISTVELLLRKKFDGLKVTRLSSGVYQFTYKKLTVQAAQSSFGSIAEMKDFIEYKLDMCNSKLNTLTARDTKND